MPVRREIEIKLRLEGRAQHDKLCREMGTPADAWEQINHYFRSEDGRIPGEEGVIRIRLERGKAVFTVKLGALKDGLASAQEYEEPGEAPWRRCHPRRSRCGLPGMQASMPWSTGSANAFPLCGSAR